MRALLASPDGTASFAGAGRALAVGRNRRAADRRRDRPSAALDRQISLASQAMLHLIAVAIAAYVCDRLTAVVSAIAAVTALNFFFVPPRYTLAVEHREHLITLATMLGVALLVSWLSGRVRSESRLAAESERRARQLSALATELLGASDEAEAVAAGERALRGAFERVVLVTLDAEGALHPTTWPGAAGAAVAALRHRRGGGDRAGHGPLARHRCLGRAARLARSRHRRRSHRAGTCGRRDRARPCDRARQRARPRAVAAARRPGLARRPRPACSARSCKAPFSPPSRTTCARRWQRSSPRPRRCRRSASACRRPSRSACWQAFPARPGISPASPKTRCSSCDSRPARWRRGGMAIARGDRRQRPRPAAPRACGARIEARIEAALPLLRGDATLLAQLLTNLLDNACKYSTGAILLSACRAPDAVVVSVADRGPGVTPEDEARLFEPFFRGEAKAAGEGAGLGLALCRAIAAGAWRHARLRPPPPRRQPLHPDLPIEPQPEAGA